LKPGGMLVSALGEPSSEKAVQHRSSVRSLNLECSPLTRERRPGIKGRRRRQ
jgi:hypothetical protein